MRGAEVVTASVRQRVEQHVDPERVAVHGELVEVARVVSFALEGVAEIGVVRDENDQPAVLIGDTTCVRLGAVRAAFGGVAGAGPIVDRRDLDDAGNLELHVKDRMVLRQVDDRVSCGGRTLLSSLTQWSQA